MNGFLKEALDALNGKCAPARAAILPPPYKRGHFRVYQSERWHDDEWFTSTVCGDTCFVRMTDALLARYAKKMGAYGMQLVEPSHSPLHTTLYLAMRLSLEEGGMDCPQLARLCLDLDPLDAARSAHVLRLCDREIHKEYALALRKHRAVSALPALARYITHVMHEMEVDQR